MTKNKLNNVFLSKPNNGFAMVLALVVMTVMFVVVASLSSTRQMWGFFSTKQLDRANIDFPTKADSENWFRLNRESLFRNGSVTAPVYLVAAGSGGSIASASGDAASTVVFFAQDGDEPFPAVILDGNGSPDYPTYGTNVVTFDVPFQFNLGANPVLPGRTGANDPPYDPYWGMMRYGGSYGVMFKREMLESSREIREERFNDNTQLRAWMSIDGALRTFIRYRVMPMSAFTYYYAPTYTGLTSVGVTTNHITPLSAAYNYDGYSVSSIGMGRIYVDELVNFQTSGTTNNPVLGFPIVATHGFTNLGTTTFHTPLVYGVSNGGTIVTNLNTTNFWPHRYAALKGMLLSSDDVSQRLITRFANTAPPFRSRELQQGVMSNYVNNFGSTAVRVRLDTATNTTLLESGGPQSSLLLSTNAVGMWAVDHTNRLVTLRPSLNYFTNFVVPPSSIFFEFYGPNAASYKLIVNVPSVAALGVTAEQQQLSVISSNTIVIPTTGFNSDNSGNGAMLVSPRIEIDSPTSPVNIGGYVITGGSVTQAQGPVLRPFYQYAITNVPDPMHTITGGLAYFGTAPNIVGGTLAARIVPSVGYLQGTTVPPAVPAVFDYRIAAQDMVIYQMIAVPNP
jgi:hypothetical protein